MYLRLNQHTPVSHDTNETLNPHDYINLNLCLHLHLQRTKGKTYFLQSSVKLHATIGCHFPVEKVYITPSPMGGGLHNPPNYETVYITPWTFQNRSNYPPKAVLKNNSKSQKNHKIENPIVLDSKWVDLHNEHIIWYALVHFFTAMKKT